MRYPSLPIEIMTTAKKINLFSIVLIAVTVLGITADILSKVIWFMNNSDPAGSDAYRSGYEAGRAAADASLPLTFAQGFGAFMIVPIVIAFFRLWINFIGIMATVKKGEVFSELLEWRIRHVGIAMVVIYVCGWILSICMNFYFIGPMCSSICCGVGFIIVSYIFELARNIKEDQEFMV